MNKDSFMKNYQFYLCLNVLNILLYIYMFGIMVVCFIVFSVAENYIIPICTIILCILAKGLCLPVLLTVTERFFPRSILSNVAKELKTNASRRRRTLVLSCGYEVIIILYYALQDIKIEHFEGISIIAYETVTLGGICMFYITLFGIWKIQDKLKRREF